MGYYLRAFVGEPIILKKIAAANKSATIVVLNVSISMIPLTDILFDEINKFQNSENISRFEFLNSNIETSILNIINNETIAYVEADYFAGKGGQMGIIWKEGKRLREYGFGQDVINSILKYFGVEAVNNLDEFATLNLGKHRSTDDWAK